MVVVVVVVGRGVREEGRGARGEGRRRRRKGMFGDEEKEGEEEKGLTVPISGGTGYQAGCRQRWVSDNNRLRGQLHSKQGRSRIEDGLSDSFCR